MTQAKQTFFTPIEIDDADFIDLQRDPKLEEENAEFEQFKSEMHDAQFDAKITVGKKMTDSRGRPIGRQTFECFECGVEDYTFSQLCTRIREDFGTGLYQIHGRDSKGRYKFKKTVGILAPNSTDNVPAGNDVGVLIDKFSDAQERQAMRMEQMFSKLAGPQTGGDAIEQIAKLALAIGPILKVMNIGQPAAAPRTLMEQLTEMKMVQELFSGDGGGAGGESNLYTLLTETVKSMGPALGLAIAAQTESGAIPATGPILPALPNPGIENQEKNTLNEELESMRPQINFLVAQAKAGADPVDVANALIPGIPENSLESIEAFLQQENVIDICAQVNGEVNSYRQWFIEWREIMLKMLFEMFVDESDKIPPEDSVESLTLEPDEEQTAIVAGNDKESLDPGATSKSDDRDPNEPPPGNGGD